MYLTRTRRDRQASPDVFQNNSPASLPLLFRLLGFVGPRTPPVFKLLLLRDRAALQSATARWAATPNLARLVPSHGEVVTESAAAVLRRAAAGL